MTTPPRKSLDVIVLAGGESRRMGYDKAQVKVDGRSLLTTVLDGLHQFAEHHALAQVIVVRDELPLDTSAYAFPISFTREKPPFSGPAAAIAAGAQHIRSRLVAILSVDAPHSPQALPALLDAAENNPGSVIAAEIGGRSQPLLALWPAELLTERCTPPGRWVNVAAKKMLETLPVVACPVSQDCRDFDTRSDLEAIGCVEFPAD